jgi:membrane glycosyltransferase
VSSPARRGVIPLDWALLALFVAVMAWEAFIAWQSVLGFAGWLLGRRGRTRLERLADEVDLAPTGRTRTALLVPVYNEDPAAVYAAVRVMARSLARAGGESGAADVDVHVLSDTSDLEVAAAEEKEHERLILAWDGEVPGEDAGLLPGVFYRRRELNTGRKAGNIAEFCARSGGDYDFMIVLDADSLMTGRHAAADPPDGGVPAGRPDPDRQLPDQPRDALRPRSSSSRSGSTPRCRCAGSSPGRAADGSYWGHNAILRVAAFAAHCGLPVLPGRPPLGGEILCHDIVEGALLRRAGWEVELLPESEGTWEEMPTNLADTMSRERRWCQGNLQHVGVLSLPGLRAASRAHILTGIMGYLAAPVGFAFLVLATLRALATPEGEGLGLLAYGLTEPGPAATGLLLASLALILVPRALSLVRVLADPEMRRGYGGAARFLASALCEQVFSMLVGPLFVVTHARLVASTLAGRVVRWDRQSRADRAVGWAEATRRYGGPAALGRRLRPGRLVGRRLVRALAGAVRGGLDGSPGARGMVEPRRPWSGESATRPVPHARRDVARD